jgi:hypothetical protein
MTRTERKSAAAKVGQGDLWAAYARLGPCTSGVGWRMNLWRWRPQVMKRKLGRKEKRRIGKSSSFRRVSSIMDEIETDQLYGSHRLPDRPRA